MKLILHSLLKMYILCVHCSSGLMMWATNMSCDTITRVMWTHEASSNNCMNNILSCINV